MTRPDHGDPQACRRQSAGKPQVLPSHVHDDRTYGAWRIEDGSRRMEVGGWRPEAGG
jgi:hypothetical protein